MHSAVDLFVVENHDEVLEPLYRKIGSKKLPYEGMLMLHLDSHSDLSVPKDLMTSTDGELSKNDVFRNVSIESWIIPPLYSGHISSVFWLYPWWTIQSFQKESFFEIGKCKEDNSLRVTSASNHFLSEDSFEHKNDLLHLREVQLLVQKIDPSSCPISSGLCATLKKLSDAIKCRKNGFILDIDLDFFSTKDPFTEMLGLELYNSLKQAYKFMPPESFHDCSINKCIKARREQLSKMKRFWMSQLDGCNHMDKEINFISDEMLTASTKHDLMWLHEIGTGIDDCPLPHHVSTNEEVDQLICYMEEFLSKLPPPSVIFVSRSSEDDFCPPEQVDMIQVKVLDMLNRLYKCIRSTFLYSN